MSCNGCRVLRKGCSETCILRPCLQWIENMEAKGYATVFVAKFFGRAGLMGFISAMPEHQLMVYTYFTIRHSIICFWKPNSWSASLFLSSRVYSKKAIFLCLFLSFSRCAVLFQSLLFEACGRTMNPMFVAVGLLWSGNWHVCQAAVNTVLKGGSLSLLSLSICLLENLSLSAPCFPAIAKNGGLPFSSTVRVDGPTQMVFPLSLNASEDNPFGRHTISLGIGFPEAGGEESKERTRSVSRENISNKNRHWEVASARNVEPCFLWQKDGQCDNSNQLHANIELWTDNLGQEFYDSNQKSVHLQGMRVATRRVRARIEAISVAPSAYGEVPHDEFPVSANEAEQLELDLTLKVKGGRGNKMVGTKKHFPVLEILWILKTCN